MACLMSCFLCLLHGGPSFGLWFIFAAPPGGSGGSGGFLRSTWRKDVEAPDRNPLYVGDA
jgi:hypothetical protein